MTIWTASVIGLIMGIIAALSKKLVLIVWGLAVVLIIVLFVLSPSGSNAPDWGWGNWIASLVFANLWCFIGYSGVTMIKEEFFKK